MQIRWRVRGWGSSNSDDWKKNLALYAVDAILIKQLTVYFKYIFINKQSDIYSIMVTACS